MCVPLTSFAFMIFTDVFPLYLNKHPYSYSLFTEQPYSYSFFTAHPILLCLNIALK